MDAVRTLHPDEPMFTFWSYLRNRWPRDAGLRLDHLLLSSALAPRLLDAGVDRDIRGVAHASDHAPAWVEIGPPGHRPPTRNPSGTAKHRRRKASGTAV